MKQLAFDLAQPASPTLDNFVVGRNAELVQRLRAVAQGSASERALYVWGERGSGRTHLLRATSAALRARGIRAPYVADGDELQGEAARGAQALAVDDVDRLDDAAQAALFKRYNDVRENGGIFVAAGSAPPAELRLREDVVTRLAWGLVYEIHALSDDEKMRALSEHAASRGFGLAPEVSRYLLARSQRDMGSLMATMEALDRYSMETKRPVTVPLVREMLEPK